MVSFKHLPVTSEADNTENWQQLQVELVGPWAELALSAKLEAVTGDQTIRVRRELMGSSARLRGNGKVKAAEEITAGATIATLPLGFRPPATIAVTGSVGSSAAVFIVTAAGVVTSFSAISAGTAFSLDGLSFNLT